MDADDLTPLVKRNIVPIALGTLGLLMLSVGLFQMYSNWSPEPNIVFEESKENDEALEIVIDVEGAVLEPGVYKLSSDERIVDALAKAGGLSEDADRDFVEKNINLAGKLTDGLKIYIPRVGEEILSVSSSDTAAAVININNASIADLKSLNGIGDVTAQKIVDGRPYASTEELLERKIVGASTFEKIKDEISY